MKATKATKMNQTKLPVAAERMTHVKDMMANLFTRVAVAEGLAMELEKRLSTVLVPTDASIEYPQPAGLVPLADQISEAEIRLHAANDKIQSILERLEL